MSLMDDFNRIHEEFERFEPLHFNKSIMHNYSQDEFLFGEKCSKKEVRKEKEKE